MRLQNVLSLALFLTLPLAACGSPTSLSGEGGDLADDSEANLMNRAGGVTLSDGFISLRLDLSAQIPKGAPRHVIAVLSGPNFWQRKHILVGTSSAGEAFLDWPFVAASRDYSLLACVDSNNDGLCNESIVGTRVRPRRGVADQTLRLGWAQLRPNNGGRTALNRFGPKLGDFSVRVTSAPNYDSTDRKSPWYAGEHLIAQAMLRVQAGISHRPDTAPAVGELTFAPGYGVASTATLPGILQQDRTYRLELSTCNFLPNACTQATLQNPARKDVDLTLPALRF